MTREEAEKWFEMRLKSGILPGSREAFNQAIAALKEPERKHGHWILVGKNEHDYETSLEEKCSMCGRYVYRYDTELQDRFCPLCGAIMDEEE